MAPPAIKLARARRPQGRRCGVANVVPYFLPVNALRVAETIRRSFLALPVCSAVCF